MIGMIVCSGVYLSALMKQIIQIHFFYFKNKRTHVDNYVGAKWLNSLFKTEIGGEV